MRTHRTRDGKRIALEKMSDSHLINTILLIRSRACEGVEVVVGTPGYGNGDDIDVDIITVYGKRALDLLGHSHYVKEWKRRKAARDVKR